MHSDDLRVIDGAAAGVWIEPRLGGEFGAVTLQVPRGYEEYARIFHPAKDADSNPVRWADVAEGLGKIAHREMQWHTLLGFSDPDELSGSYGPDTAVGPRWSGYDPPTGRMDLKTLDALCGILAVHTTNLSDCYFGLCTIQGWLDSFSADELKPLLKLPWGRDHVVLSGSLSAVDQIAENWSKPSPSRAIFVLRQGGGPPYGSNPADLSRREAPNLIWPADRMWFVASEVDFDSTLVGGSVKLIEAIVELSELEARQMEPTDSLAADADHLNSTDDR
jgi:hypothetical protein